MQPDLKYHHIDEIHIDTTFKVQADVVDQIRRLSPPDEDNDSFFADTYKAGKRSYKPWGWFIERDREKSEYRIVLHYLSRSNQPRKKHPSIANLIDALSSVEILANVDCRVAFNFPKSINTRSILPLPLRLIQLPNMPFDEIIAALLTKRDDAFGDYQVSLGLMPTGHLLETIFFSLQTRLDNKLVDNIIEKALSISKKFILEG